MDYLNLFINKTHTELKLLYNQYLEWCDTAIISDNELGKIRDIYCEKLDSSALLIMELDLLREIAKRWGRSHSFPIGASVKMNIDKFYNDDRDGVEVTRSGKNYWEYMFNHPDETYKIISKSFNDNVQMYAYELDGYMANNTWYEDELILVE